MKPLILLAFAAAANAHPIPTMPTESYPAASASAQAGAAAGAKSGSASGATVTSGGDSTHVFGFVMPSPVFTPPMPISSCPQANVTQDAIGVGWNFYSRATSSVNTNNCTAIIVYNALLERCSWESARKVLDGLTARVMPGVKLNSPEMVDLTIEECAMWKMPPVPAAPPPRIVYVPGACPMLAHPPISKKRHGLKAWICKR